MGLIKSWVEFSVEQVQTPPQSCKSDKHIQNSNDQISHNKLKITPKSQPDGDQSNENHKKRTSTVKKVIKKGNKWMWKNYGRPCIAAIIENDLRPTVPKTCHNDWHQLTQSCWFKDPRKRPTFSSIVEFIKKYISKIT